MSTKPNSPPRTDSSEDHRLRPGIKWAVAAVSLFCLASLLWLLRSHTPGPPSPTEPPGVGAESQGAGESARQAAEHGFAGGAQGNAGSEAGTPMSAGAASSTNASAAAPAPAAVPVAIDPAMGTLVAGLKALAGTNAALTAEAAAAWRTNFMNLVQSGPAAIPALRAFLDQKEDYLFSQEAGQALGYSSARLAAIDALRQIGGPDAVQAMDGLLGTTQSPTEIAVLARDLEEASPGQYKDQVLAAARAGLASALKSTDPQLDVAPLFEVFQHYGDASVIPDLNGAMGQWKYYATIALANLPDNAGVPSLLSLADPASGIGSRLVALQMVAQLATTNPDARQYLATQVANNAIPASIWPFLTSPLAGDQYYPVDSALTPYPQLQSMSDLKATHLSYGNQNLYLLPGNQNVTADGLQQQLALVDALLQATSDPAAVEALQQARTTLTQRSTRAAAQTPPATAGTGP